SHAVYGPRTTAGPWCRSWPYSQPGWPSGTAPPKEPSRVGQIIIIGNEDTPDSVVLRYVTMYPGEVFAQDGPRRVEKNMRNSGLWKSVQLEARPSLVIPDSPYLDVMIRLEEQPLNWLMVALVYELNQYCLTLDSQHLDCAMGRIENKARDAWKWLSRSLARLGL